MGTRACRRLDRLCRHDGHGVRLGRKKAKGNGNRRVHILTVTLWGKEPGVATRRGFFWVPFFPWIEIHGYRRLPLRGIGGRQAFVAGASGRLEIVLSSSHRDGCW
jgi:hypothetical protein